MARPKGQPKLGGRQKGTANKDTSLIRDMIIQALNNAGGVEYLQRQSLDNPTAFMTLVGKVLPTQVSGDPDAPLVTKIIHESR